MNEIKKEWDMLDVKCDSFPQNTSMDRSGLTENVSTSVNLSYTCAICKFIFQSKKAYESHIVSHSNQIYICKECGVVINEKSAFIQHYQQHMNKLYQCDICDEHFDNEVRLRRHFNLHRNKSTVHRANCKLNQNCSVCNKWGKKLLEDMKLLKYINGVKHDFGALQNTSEKLPFINLTQSKLPSSKLVPVVILDDISHEIINMQTPTDTDCDNQQTPTDTDGDNQQTSTDIDGGNNKQIPTDADGGDNQPTPTVTDGDNQQTSTDIDGGNNKQMPTDIDGNNQLTLTDTNEMELTDSSPHTDIVAPTQSMTHTYSIPQTDTVEPTQSMTQTDTVEPTPSMSHNNTIELTDSSPHTDTVAPTQSMTHTYNIPQTDTMEDSMSHSQTMTDTDSTQTYTLTLMDTMTHRDTVTQADEVISNSNENITDTQLFKDPIMNSNTFGMYPKITQKCPKKIVTCNECFNVFPNISVRKLHVCPISTATQHLITSDKRQVRPKKCLSFQYNTKFKLLESYKHKKSITPTCGSCGKNFKSNSIHMKERSCNICYKIFQCSTAFKKHIHTVTQTGTMTPSVTVTQTGTMTPSVTVTQTGTMTPGVTVTHSNTVTPTETKIQSDLTTTVSVDVINVNKSIRDIQLSKDENIKIYPKISLKVPKKIVKCKECFKIFPNISVRKLHVCPSSTGTELLITSDKRCVRPKKRLSFQYNTKFKLLESYKLKKTPTCGSCGKNFKLNSFHMKEKSCNICYKIFQCSTAFKKHIHTVTQTGTMTPGVTVTQTGTMTPSVTVAQTGTMTPGVTVTHSNTVTPTETKIQSDLTTTVSVDVINVNKSIRDIQLSKDENIKIYPKISLKVPKKIVKCKECFKIFPNISVRKLHVCPSSTATQLLITSDKRHVRPKKCLSFQYNTKFKLLESYKLKKSITTCGSCGKNFKSIFFHMKEKSCNICYQIFQCSTAFKKHEKIHINTVTPSDLKTHSDFKTTLGDEVISVNENVRHKQLSDDEDKSHSLKLDQKIKYKLPKTIYECKKCFQTFPKLSIRKLHICPSSTGTKLLKSTDKRHVQPKKHLSFQYNTKFQLLNNYKTNTERHTKVKMCSCGKTLNPCHSRSRQCNSCHRIFNCFTAFRKHQLQHCYAVSKLVDCKKCGKNFKLNSWHLKKRDCNSCHRKFKCFTTFRKHKLQHCHAVSKSVDCKKCFQTFEKKSLLHMHICPSSRDTEFLSVEDKVKKKENNKFKICKKCGKNFQLNSWHLKMRKCNACHRKFQCFTAFRKHKLQHCNMVAKLVDCKKCRKKFQMNSWHLKRRECNSCHKIFKCFTAFRKHQLQHCNAVSKPVNCKKCFQTFEKKSLLHMHICPSSKDTVDLSVEDKVNKKENNKFKICKKCGKNFQLDSWHLKRRDCNSCYRIFKCFTAFRKHKLQHCLAVSKSIDCKKCSQTFEKKSLLQMHICSSLGDTENLKSNDNNSLSVEPKVKKKEKIKLKMCKKCGKNFMFNSLHLKSRQCNSCHRKFQCFTTFRKHKVQNCNAVSKLVDCKNCFQTFEKKSLLQMHICPSSGDTENVKSNDNNSLSVERKAKKKENIKLKICKKCGKNFMFNSWHLKSRQCNSCHRKFPCFTAFRKHKLQHCLAISKPVNCKKCFQTFEKKSLLQMHICPNSQDTVDLSVEDKVNKKENNKFKICKECGKNFKSNSWHLKIRECNSCHRKFQCFTAFRKHQLHCNAVAKLVDCKKCFQTFEKKSLLQMHICPSSGDTENVKSNDNNILSVEHKVKKKENIKFKICKKCGKNFQMNSWHLKRRECNFCHKIFKCFITFRKHKLQHCHAVSKLVDCKKCFQTFGKKSLLHMHICPESGDTENLSVIKKKENIKFKICSKCGKNFMFNSWHLKRRECNSCHKIFKCFTAFRKHKVQHCLAVSKPVDCKKCLQTFEKKSLLQMHICPISEDPKVLKPTDIEKVYKDKKRKGTKVKICQTCSRSFNFNSCHMMSKKCTICNQMFKCSSAFKKHQKLHSFPFTCDMCSKVFIGPLSLRRHKKTHIQDSNKVLKFVCSICGLHFKFKTKLRSHMITHSDKSSNICQVCGKQFKYKKGLLKHVYSHKKEFL